MLANSRVVTRMVAAILSLVGVFVSLYLSLQRVGLIGELTCGLNGGCQIVQASPYAVLFGVPLAFVGVAGYAFLTTLTLFLATERWHGSRFMVLTFHVTALIAFLFSLYLTALEALVIHAWCQWCIISALVSSCIFIAALLDRYAAASS